MWYVLVAEETGFLFFGGGIIQIRKKRDFDQTKEEVSIKSFNDIFEICWRITRFGNEKNVNFSCGSAIAAIGFDVGRCRSVYQRHMLTADYL